MNAGRAALAAALISLAVVLQASVFDAFAWDGVVPDLALLVVVGAALVRGGEFGMVTGFAAGVILDLAPPADHLAGRWALALLVVGYVAGRVRQDARPGTTPNATTVMVTVAACSFVGSSVFALTGIILRDPAVDFGELLQVIGISLVWDVLLAPLVLPVVMAAFRRLEPAR
ncbi:rod shape-determining protein MreD [Nocardioides sp. CER19]|uniref:rod shape-determining protein MreD n=1 Tax=Nocardioides sp. CER19 TaxID=3038538 RepID=UPI002449BA77|nr:rod shape-determining protein MreD [Nocardioides sp. CER19]MDH2414054.1 rod shape-determining protein MreD [Nocardioides sp. CER19]